MTKVKMGVIGVGNMGSSHCGSFMAGQIAGMINDIKPAKEIIEELFADAKNLLKETANQI